MFWAFWKGHFSIFCKFLNDAVETVFWESETEPSRPNKFKDGHSKLFRKWFWSNLEVKNEYSEHLEREIFRVFFQFLSDQIEMIYWKSKAKHQQFFESKFGHRNLLIKWFWSFPELKNQYCGRLKTAFFSVFAGFWLTKLKPFYGKVRQNVQKDFNQNLVLGNSSENYFEVTLTSKTNVLSVWKGRF